MDGVKTSRPEYAYWRFSIMANKYINLYMNNPTADNTDGTQVSTDDTETSPIAVTLDASKNEVKYIKCAIRCNSGYKTSGNVTLSFVGNNKAKWALSDDGGYTNDNIATKGTFSDTLTISNEITDKNKIFWVKATSSSDEEPQNDKSTNIELKATIMAVE